MRYWGVWMLVKKAVAVTRKIDIRELLELEVLLFVRDQIYTWEVWERSDRNYALVTSLGKCTLLFRDW